MIKKNIIIVGYPKSGTTWASRLVAELLQCPLDGDWGYETIKNLYSDGEDRDSEFKCFKSHHTYNEIKKACESNIYKIIYVIRDPRDIVISGVYFFSFSLFYLTSLWKINLVGIAVIFRKIFNRLISKRAKKKQMIHAVLYGKKDISYWLKTSWEEHYKEYLNKDILFVRYENLIDNPDKECIKIMKYLKIKTDLKHIRESINNQSFIKRKHDISNQKNNNLKKLIRIGSYGYWQQEFTKKEIYLFKEKLNNLNPFYEF